MKPRISALQGLVLAMTTSAGFAAEKMPPECCWVGTVSSVTTGLLVSWAFSDGDCDTTHAISTVGTVATQYQLGYSTCFDICCGPKELIFDSESDPDTGDAVVRTIHGSSNVDLASAEGECTAAGGMVESISTVIFHSRDWYKNLTPDVYTGYALDLFLSTAGAASAQEWVLDCPPNAGGVTLLPSVHFQVTGGEMGYAGECEEKLVPPQSSPYLLSVDSMTIQIDVEYANSTTGSEVIRGVYAMDSELSPIRLGVFTDSSFDGSIVNDQFVVDSKPVALPITISLVNAAKVSLKASASHFSRFDGDINNDGAVCWSDRHYFQTLNGLDLSDLGYNVRADFDLDGDIDGDDFDAFLVVFNTDACAADYDCSGAVNSNDFFVFTADFQNSDPKADFNGDGLVNSQDWNDFLTAFFAGC